MSRLHLNSAVSKSRAVCLPDSFSFPTLFSTITLFLLVVLALLASGKVLAKSAGATDLIRLNQVGYLPSASKVAIVQKSLDADTFEIIDADSGETAFQGPLGKARVWPHSKEKVRKADFSQFVAEGQYKLKVGDTVTLPFTISKNALDDVHKAALKSFYFNRASMAIDKEYGGRFARDAGHLDTKIKVHKSAASETRKAGSVISAPKGWYDAGDYGKYSVNSGISTYTLLLGLQQFEQLYAGLDVNIPESANAIPDLLDEIKWNLDWFVAMQDDDGGVYHKLTALGFSSMQATPAKEDKQRYVIGKSVTATLNYAAVFAAASRVMRNYASEFPGLADQYLANAQRAYAWALANPETIYTQPKDVSTGAYDDRKVTDEFAWAAAELSLATGNKQYWAHFKKLNVEATNGLSWPEVAPLPYISLLEFGQEMLSADQVKWLKQKLIKAADQELKLFEDSAYNVAMSKDDFVWGSNSVALNNGLIALQAYRVTSDQRYLKVAQASVDYVLGTNATGFSFVTGFGHRSPVNIHHRPSSSDKIADPIPGFIAGGPHPGKQDKCKYEGKHPATTYVDAECSYATNEIAINWNAPLVYMLGAMISSQSD